MSEEYSDTELDLTTLIDIIESKSEVRIDVVNLLQNHDLKDFMNCESDTIGLERVILIFENDTLQEVKMKW